MFFRHIIAIKRINTDCIRALSSHTASSDSQICEKKHAPGARKNGIENETKTIS